MKHLKRAIPIVLALVMAFALSISAWASNEYAAGGGNRYVGDNNGADAYITYVNSTVDHINGGSSVETLDKLVQDANGTSYVTINSITVTGGTGTTLSKSPVKSTGTSTVYADVTVSGGKLTITGCKVGDVTVTGGELVIDATAETGDITISGNSTVTVKGKTGDVTVSGGTLTVESTATTGAIDIKYAAVVTVKGTTGTIKHEGTGLLTLGGNASHDVTATGYGDITVISGTAGVNTISATDGTHVITSEVTKTKLSVSGNETMVYAVKKYDSINVDGGTLFMADTEGENRAVVTGDKISVGGGTVHLVTDLTIYLTNHTEYHLPTITFDTTGITATIMNGASGDFVGAGTVTDIASNSNTLIVKNGKVTTNGTLNTVTVQESGSLEQNVGSTIKTLTVSGGTAALTTKVETLNVSGGTVSSITGNQVGKIEVSSGSVTVGNTSNAATAVGAVTVSGTGSLTVESESTLASLNVDGGTVIVEGDVKNTHFIKQSGGTLTVKNSGITVKGAESGTGNLVVNNPNPENTNFAVTATGEFNKITVESGKLNMNATATTLTLKKGNLELNDSATVTLAVNGDGPLANISFASGVKDEVVTVKGTVNGGATVTVTGGTSADNSVITYAPIETTGKLNVVTVAMGGGLTNSGEIVVLNTSVDLTVSGTVGTLNVNAGTTTSNGNIDSANVEENATLVQTGGTIGTVDVKHGGKLTQNIGATINTLTVAGSATLAGTVKGDGVAQANPDETPGDGLIVDGGSVTLNSGANITRATVNSGALTAKSGASIADLTLASGTVTVETGANVTGTATVDGGKLTQAAQATSGSEKIATLTVNSGEAEISGVVTTATVADGKLTVKSGSEVTETLTVNNGEVSVAGDVKGDGKPSANEEPDPIPGDGLIVNGGTVWITGTVAKLTVNNEGAAVVNSDAVVTAVDLNGGELTLNADNTKDYVIAGEGGSLTVNQAKEVYAYGTFGTITNKVGTMYLGYTYKDSAKAVPDDGAEQNAAVISTTVKNGLVVSGGKVEVGFAATPATTATVTIDNKAGHGSKIVDISGTGEVKLLKNATVSHSYTSADGTALTDQNLLVKGEDGEPRVVAVNVGDGTSASKFSMAKGSKIVLNNADYDKMKLSALLNHSKATATIEGGTIETKSAGENSRGVDNYGTLTLGTKDTTNDQEESKYVNPVVIKMDGGGTALKNDTANAKATIYDADIDVTGVGKGIVTTDNAKLDIQAGAQSSEVNTLPTETVNVYVQTGTALELGSDAKWSIRGGYNTSVFQGSKAAALGVQSSNLTSSQPEKNLTGARFVSTDPMTVANAEASLPVNHYLRQNNDAANNTDVSVVDAAWEIQFFMENSFENITAKGYGNTTVWEVTEDANKVKTGTYTMNTNIDLSKNTEGWGAVVVNDDADKTIAPVSELRVIDLNGHTLKSDANVIALDKEGDKLDDLTVQDTSTGAGGKLEAIDVAGESDPSAVSATAGTLTVAGGTVTASGTAATIAVPTPPDEETYSPTINVKGGTVVQTGTTSAIYAISGAKVNVSGGTVTAKSTNGAIAAADNAAVTVSGGAVDVSGNGFIAIKNTGKGDVTVTGGTVQSANGTAISNTDTGKVKVNAAADVTISGNGKAIESTNASAEVEIKNGTPMMKDEKVVAVAGNSVINITGDVTGSKVDVKNYSTPIRTETTVTDDGEQEAAVVVTAIKVSGEIHSTAAGEAGGVKIENYADAPVDLDVINTTPTADNSNGGAVTINNFANGTIDTNKIDASKTGESTTNGDVTIVNGKVEQVNGKYVYNTGSVNIDGTVGGGSDAILCDDLSITNNAVVDSTVTGDNKTGRVFTMGHTTASGKVTIDNESDGKIWLEALDATGAVTVNNKANGDIRLEDDKDTNDTIVKEALTLSNSATINNNAGGGVNVGNVVISGTNDGEKDVTINNKLDGSISIGEVTGNGTGDLTIKNNTETDASTKYTGSVKIASIDHTGGKVEIQNGADASSNTYTGTVLIGDRKVTNLQAVMLESVKLEIEYTYGAVSGKSVKITNYSTNRTVTQDGFSYTFDAITTGAITGKENGSDPAAVAITNKAAGTVTVTGNVVTAANSTGAVAIDNKDNGEIKITGAVTAGGTTYGDVTITNGDESAETAKTGKVAVTGAVTGNTVAITNYSTDADAVKTGKVTANGETTTENPNYGVKIFNAANAGATGTITIDAASASAIESKGGNVIVTNEANSKLTVKGIKAYDGTSTYKNVTITNGKEDAIVETGAIAITGDVTGAAVAINNYSAPTADGETVPDAINVTGTVTAAGAGETDKAVVTNAANGKVRLNAIAATNTTTAAPVVINNKADGEVEITTTITADATTDGDVTIVNGGSLEETTATKNGENRFGSVTVKGAITGKSVNVTNFATKVSETVGTITLKDITASGNSTITNKDAGKIITAKISTTGSATLDIVNEENGEIKIEPASAENAIAINTANGKLTIVNGGSYDDSAYVANTGVTGKITITATGTGSKAINAAGAVDVKNMSNGEITTGAIEAAGATTIDNTADGVITIAATGDGVDGVKVTDASLNIGSGASDGTITITAAKGNGVNFTGNGDLTIEAGTITGNSYIVNNVTTSAYGLNVGTGTGTINLAGNDLAASSATYNSVKIDRTDGIYKSIKTDTPNGYDWAKTNGTTTTLLPRTAKNYLADGATSKTDVRKIWDVDANGYRYTVQQVTSHSLDISASSAKMKAGDTKDVTFTLTVNGTKFSNQPAYVSSATVVESSVASATSTNNATWTITKTTGQADAATATVKFMDAYDTDVHGDMATFAVEAYVAPAPAPAPSPSPAPAAPAATPTVSLSGDDNSVSIGVTTKGGTATMSEPKAADLEKVIGAGVETGEVVIDMSKLSSSIDTATVPTKTFDAIEAAVTDASNDADELTIKLPGSSVTFNAAALDAIADQATGSSISLEVSKDTVSKLATAQQNAVKALDVQDVYSITLTSGNKTISDFQGGSATVSVNYTLKAGQNAKGIVVWYVANDGTLTEVPATFSAGKVTFTVSHFSNYVIAYDAERAAACPQDSTCPIAAFSDADAKAWYHDGVHWALENGAMSGMGNGTFAPNGTTTRAMVAQILWNLEGKPAYVGMSEYTDVDNDDWFGPAVRWASAEGIVTGYDGKFAPNDPVTREQLATMLYRYAQYKNIDVSVGEDTNILSYEDAFNVNTWAMAAMQWACGAGVMNGAEVNGTIYLQPQNDATRAVVATMIARFCTEVAK